MTLKELTGIDQSEISKIERGQRKLTLEQLIVLAVAFDTSMDYIAGLTDERNPYPASENRILKANSIFMVPGQK